MINVSLSGAFVQTALKVPVLSRVHLVVAGSQIEGLIVRQTEAGLGLEWSEFAGDLIQALIAQCSSPDLGWVDMPKKKPARRARERRS